MINLHSFENPELICEDASLASQSQKASTLISEILKRFTATGILPNAHHLSEAKDPTAYPDSFTDGMNSLTEKRSVYDDEGVDVFEGLQRDFDDVVASVRPGEAGNGEAGNGEAGNGEAGNGEVGNGEAGE